MKPTTSKFPGIIAVAQKMSQSLKRRFQFAYDSLTTAFDGIYIVSTFLNPAYRSLLEGSQLSF